MPEATGNSPDEKMDAASTNGVELCRVSLSLQNPFIETGDYTKTPKVPKLKEQGYDGIIALDGQIVAFYPGQVKSATGNNGDFDPANPDIRRSFAGQQAATADTMALATAQQRLEAGEDAEAVRQETGWHKGADGKWRFEINDADAKLLKEPSDPDAYADIFDEAASRSNGVPLGKVLDHPALFAAYPKLQTVRLIVDDKTAYAGSYSAEENAIRVRDPYSYDGGQDELLSILLHEVQHGIQHIEGFATGGNSELFASGPMFDQRARDLAADLGENLTGSVNADPAEISIAAKYGDQNEMGEIARKHGFATVDEALSFLKSQDEKRTPFGQYRRLAGEVEARNTQARQNLTDAQRRATPPSQTADVADSDVIVMFNGKVAMSAPTPANAAPDAAPQPPRTPAATIRAAINRAYGKLLGQLEAKGLVTLAQTEAQAIEAAAQARAKKTGGDVGAIRDELMESVKQSAAMRLWVGSRTVNDAIIPETPEYAGSTTGDLAYVPEGAKIPAGPLRITVGTAPERHRGRGITHMADNAKNDARRMPKNETGNLTEDLMREAVTVMSGATQVHNDGSYIFVNPSMKKAIVANYINGFYSVTSVRPYSGDPTVLWGTPEWSGRLAFPSRETAAASPSATDRQDSLPRPDRAGLEVHSEKFDLTNSTDKPQATAPVVSNSQFDQTGAH